MWTPTPYAMNDREIMETTMDDPKYKVKETWKLEVLNNCRMYLGIIFLSEITDIEGKIPLENLNGNNPQPTTKYNYPRMRS